jgi:hypothetical protein
MLVLTKEPLAVCGLAQECHMSNIERGILCLSSCLERRARQLNHLKASRTMSQAHLIIDYCMPAQTSIQCAVLNPAVCFQLDCIQHLQQSTDKRSGPAFMEALAWEGSSSHAVTVLSPTSHTGTTQPISGLIS